MRITVFTSNQARHVHLIEALAAVASEVYAVQECTTVLTDEADDSHRSSVMRAYFSKVADAQRRVFGHVRFLSPNVRSLAIVPADLSRIHLSQLEPALQSDVYIVFGSSFIKGALCDFLVQHRAVNVHMGVSPYYRGHSCNFWALHDGNPEYVGGTVHLLSRGLDSGPMLFHAFPRADEGCDPFDLGMRAVRATHDALVRSIENRSIVTLEPVEQDRSSQIRYSRGVEFTDAVASAYLAQLPDTTFIGEKLRGRDLSKFLRPVLNEGSSSHCW